MENEYHHDEQGRPRIILPPQGIGKVIQVKFKEPTDFLFMADKQNKFHSDILRETLKRFEKNFGEILTKENKFMVNHEGENYILIGAGKSKREDNLITLGHKSLDYELWFNEDNFNEKIKPYIPKEIKFKFQRLIY